MKNLLKKAIRIIFFLGLGIFLVWLIIKDFTPEQWQHIRQAFYEANYRLLFPIFITGIASHYIRALRWRLLLTPVGYSPGKGNMFCAVMIGYLINMAVPRMGEVARCGIVAKQERIPVDMLIGTMIAERLIDILSLLILIFITIVIQPDKTGHFFNEYIWQKITLLFQPAHLLRNLLIISGILVLIIIGFYLLRHTGWYGRFRKLLTGIRQGLLTAFRLRQKSLFLGLTFLMWGCYFLMVYIGFYCFSTTAHLGVKAGLSVLSFGSIGMSVTQGGLGAYQLLVEKTLGLYGIAEVYGFAFGWLSWLAQAALILIVGVGCMIALPLLRKKEPQSMTNDEFINYKAVPKSRK